MEKYKNKSEFDTIQIITEIEKEKYVYEIPFAIEASNIVAVNYMVSRLDDNDVYSNITEWLSNTTNVLVAEVLLEAVNFEVFRRHNACLSRIKSLEVLEYIINHDYAQFNLAYRKSECLRYATMNDDYERVKVFVSKKHYRNFSLLSRGLDTNDKNCIELAFANENDKMLTLFINSGAQYVDNLMSDKLKNHLTLLKGEICKSKSIGKRKLAELYFNGEDHNDALLDQAFPECLGNKRIINIRVQRLFEAIHKSTSI